ncbi:MAG: hypothetical protein QXM62_05565 [Ignisphaera sp.]
MDLLHCHIYHRILLHITVTTPTPTPTPTPTTVVTVIADSNNVFPWACLDTDGNGVCEFVLEGNLWNCPGITRGNVQLVAKVYGPKDYQLDVVIDVNYSGTGGWVHGYPEIWVGGKPWNDYGPAPEGFITSERVDLPIRVGDLVNDNVKLCVYVDSYSITHTDKRILYNFAFETWLMRDTSRGRGVNDNEVELMVWFSYHGLQGAGDVADVVPITIYVDQLKVNQRFEVWHGNMGWEYFAFRTTVPRASGRYLAWCWNDFVKIAGRYTYLSGWENLYFTVSELGTEFGGIKVPWAYLKWSIRNYWLSKGLYLPVQIIGEYQPQEVVLGSCSGDVCPVKINAARPANLSGYMEFKVGYGGQITTNKGTINVAEGDIVKIEFNSVGGRIVIPRDGWTSMSEVGVSAIYVNNQKVVENAVITGSSFRIDLSSIKSELKATLWGSGWTNVTYNGVAHLEDLLAYEAKSVFILATTSEGVSRSILARHNYVTLAEIWNLDYSSFKELLIELGAPDNILYDVWKALGGNPRLAIALRARGWRLDVLEEDLYKGVKVLLESIARRFRKGLEEVVEDIDKVSEHPELGKYLLEANLIIPIDRPCIGYTPPIDKGMGIGKLYAWQTPLHQRLVGRYLEEQKDG